VEPIFIYNTIGQYAYAFIRFPFNFEVNDVKVIWNLQ